MSGRAEIPLIWTKNRRTGKWPSESEINEIEKAALTPGEDEELEKQYRKRQMDAESSIPPKTPLPYRL